MWLDGLTPIRYIKVLHLITDKKPWGKVYMWEIQVCGVVLCSAVLCCASQAACRQASRSVLLCVLTKWHIPTPCPPATCRPHPHSKPHQQRNARLGGLLISLVFSLGAASTVYAAPHRPLDILPSPISDSLSATPCLPASSVPLHTTCSHCLPTSQAYDQFGRWGPPPQPVGHWRTFRELLGLNGIWGWGQK